MTVLGKGRERGSPDALGMTVLGKGCDHAVVESDRVYRSAGRGLSKLRIDKPRSYNSQ
jgi:hypothetical protein